MTMTRSEQAFDLLERFLKHTEPGGVFAWNAPDTAINVTREDFINEVIGVITAKTPGEVALETQINSLCLSLRTVYQETGKALVSAAVLSAASGPLAAALHLGTKITEVGELAAATLHVIGIDDKTIRSPITQAELDAEKASCNCETCQKDRVKK